MSSDLTNVVTPVGELFYVNISGQGKENYNEDGYEYTASVRLTGEAAEKLKGQIDALVEEKPKDHVIKSTGYVELVKDKEGTLRAPTKRKPKTEDEEATGIWQFNFKTNTTYESGDHKKIAVYNANAQKVDLGDKRIGNGSKGAISGKMRGSSYKDEFSISLYLNAIQLVKFEEYVGDAGFDAQEGDFEGVEDSDSGFVGQPEETKEEKVKPKL